MDTPFVPHLAGGWRCQSASRAPLGWTLMELMVAMTIVGLLATLAWPQYRQQQRQARRSDARAALQQVLIDQNRYRSEHPQYASSLSELGWTGEQSAQGHYQLKITHADTNSHTTEAWPLGTQSLDTDCRPLRLHWQDAATWIPSSGTDTQTDGARCWPQ